MFSFSYPVGIIPEQELKEFFNKDGEVFYKVDATFAEVPMEVVISSLMWSNDYFGKVKLTGYPYVYRDKQGYYILTWFAHSMETVEEDTPENNNVNFKVLVTKREKMGVTRNGVDILKFIGTQLSYNRSLVVLYCLAKDVAARQLSKLKCGDTVTGVGEITMHRGYRNVIITELTKKE